jgi:protein gp37
MVAELPEEQQQLIRNLLQASRRLTTAKAGRRTLPIGLIGVSCEDQATADARIPPLLRTPAGVRFVLCEPLLGPIDFQGSTPACDGSGVVADWLEGLDWVMVGGESGPGARPCQVEWVRSIVRQCKEAGVACFVKQLGANYVDAPNGIGGRQARPDPGLVPAIKRLRDPKGGDPSEWPIDLRVREFPGAKGGEFNG